MAKRSKILYEIDIKDHKDKSGEDIKLGVYGVFDTNTIHWTYYIMSFYMKGNNIFLTEDLCESSIQLNIYNVSKDCTDVPSVDDGIRFINEYKSKWETGSNDPRDKIREEKITEILDDKTQNI